MDVEFNLPWYEYILFALILAASLGIGVFYGFFDKKNKTNEEFLLGGRSMRILPVTLSLICTFVSAMSFLGFPVEIYFYGTQFCMILLGVIPLTLALAFIYVPVYFDLRLTSACQYYEWRFSRRMGILLSISSLIQLLFLMPATIWGPALALERVVGINAKWSAGFIFSICTVYSSIGGLKAVVWTDSLQAVVMLGSLLAAACIGLDQIGGVKQVLNAAEAGGRLEFFNMDTDLRTRFTLWTGTFGLPMLWLSIYAGTQAQIQRYNSVPSLRDARKCVLFNMFGLVISFFLCSSIGLLVYAKFAMCDPVASKRVTSPDQLLPLFILEIVQNSWPGIIGLFFAGITCATLSTVSSNLNASAAIVQLYVKQYRPNLTQIQLAYVAKVVSAISGLIGFGLVYVVAGVNDTIQVMPFATVVTACTVGPTFGAFTLGILFPWANDTGTLLGIVISAILSCFVTVGGILAGTQNKLPNQRLYLTTDGCNASNLTDRYPTNFTHDRTGWKKLAEGDSWEIKIWSMSYAWQAAVTIIATIILGLLFSFTLIILNPNFGKKVNKRLLSKPALGFWTRCFGQRYIDKWVEFDKDFESNEIGLKGMPNALNKESNDLSENTYM